MKGIIIINEPYIQEFLQVKFPDWVVVFMQVNKPIEFVPIPITSNTNEDITKEA